MDQYNLKRDVLPTTQSKIIDTLGDREVNNEILRQIRRQGILSEAELDPLLQKEYLNFLMALQLKSKLHLMFVINNSL